MVRCVITHILTTDNFVRTKILVNYGAPLQSETKLLGRITILNCVLTSLHQPHFWFNVVKRLNCLSYFSCLVSQLWKGVKGDIQDTKKLLNSTSSTAGWNAKKLCSVKTTFPSTFVSKKNPVRRLAQEYPRNHGIAQWALWLFYTHSHKFIDIMSHQLLITNLSLLSSCGGQSIFLQSRKSLFSTTISMMSWVI